MKTKMTVEQLMGSDGGIYFGKTLVKPGEYPVHTLQTHHEPDFEELVALGVAKMSYAEEVFPGSGEAKLELVDAGCQHEDALDLLKRGIIQFGVGNGPFNEHETNERFSIDGECSVTLFAKLTRVYGEEALAPILKYALRVDSSPTGPMEISSVLKAMYRYSDQDTVIAWGIKAVEVMILRQTDFFGEAKMTLEKGLQSGDAGKMETGIVGGNKLTIVWAKSDVNGLAAYARSKIGHNAALVIQETEPGKFYISPNRRTPLDLSEVVRLLRVSELHKAGKLQFPEGLFDRLSDEVCAESPEWYYDREKTKSIFGGGSRKQFDVPRSALTLEEVVSTVRRGLIRHSAHVVERGISSMSGDVVNRRRSDRPNIRRSIGGTVVAPDEAIRLKGQSLNEVAMAFDAK